MCEFEKASRGNVYFDSTLKIHFLKTMTFKQFLLFLPEMNLKLSGETIAVEFNCFMTSCFLWAT